MKPSCVVFDLDDTLYLERDYVRSGFNALNNWVASNLGLADFGLRAWRAFERGDRGDIFEKTLLEAGIAADKNIILTMVDLYRSHVPDIRLTADAENCLRALQGSVHLALVSDGSERSQRNKITALGLAAVFETIVLTSTLGTSFAKPHPKAFLDVEKHFGESVQHYVYVGDNPTKDFQGPHSLGWKTIRIRRNCGLYAHLEDHPFVKPDSEVADLNEVTDMFVEKGLTP